MLYEILIKLYRKKFFVVYSEKFKNELSSNYLERYMAKHPSLKPELIIVNDQIHGFKKIKKANLSLEKFPIYLEIEYEQINDENLREDFFIRSIDLYSEVTLNENIKLEKIKELSNEYNEDIDTEIVTNILSPTDQACLIYSKISDDIFDEVIESNVLGDRSYSKIENDIEKKLDAFLNFIANFNEVILKRP